MNLKKKNHVNYEEIGSSEWYLTSPFSKFCIIATRKGPLRIRSSCSRSFQEWQKFSRWITYSVVKMFLKNYIRSIDITFSRFYSCGCQEWLPDAHLLPFSLFLKAQRILWYKWSSKVYYTSFSQDIAFFDNPQNGTGQLTARLATDASNVNGVRSFFSK